MHGFDWDNVRHFLEVVRCGSATKAANTLGVNQSTVSRRLSGLEEQLGVTLFDRSNTNNWVITPLGEQLAEAATSMRDHAHLIERLAVSNIKDVSGRVRLTIGEGAFQDIVIPAVSTFCREYPRIELELLVRNEGLDLSAREADIAVRATDNPPPNVIGKRIGLIAYQIYGTKDLYDRYMEGDRTMPCISWFYTSFQRPPWVERNFPNTEIVHCVNTPGTGLQMAKEGMGLIQTGCIMADQEPSLYRIPVDYVEDGWGLWVLSHVDLRTTPRVRLLRDAIVNALSEKRDLLEGHRPFPHKNTE